MSMRLFYSADMKQAQNTARNTHNNSIESSIVSYVVYLLYDMMNSGVRLRLGPRAPYHATRNLDRERRTDSYKWNMWSFDKVV